jgi:aldehyde dehydrogenase (NAD+)
MSGPVPREAGEAAARACREARAFFDSGAARSVERREAVLRHLLEIIAGNEDRILEALRDDLGKPALEAYASELLTVKGEIRYFLRHLRSWSRPEKVRTVWWLWPSRSWIRREPFGPALILAPWNYPFQLVLLPLVAALGAGNPAVVKPSELAPATAALLEELLGRLEPGWVSVVNGGADTARALLEQPFAFFFFTGGGAIGKQVARAAAEQGAPCLLELGGRNPCLVDDSAPLRVTARRIVWGKFFNAGQTCLAPDHVWIGRARHDALVEELRSAIRELYGGDPLVSPDLARIVNRRHFERIKGYLKEGTIACGGRSDAAALRIEPTVLTGVPSGAAVLQEEIFGPVLPVLPYDRLDGVLDALARGPVPLALYLHATRRDIEERVLERTRSGSVCVNDHLMQAGVHELPFGGQGESGMGRYHGRHGFEAFSHARAVLRQPSFWDNPLRYPPGAPKLPWIRRLMK